MARLLDRPLVLRCCAFVLALGAALAGAEALRPTHHLAQDRPPVDLQAQVPQRFGAWQEVQGVRPVLPDPELQKRLDALYTQVLARTYANANGEFVMLSIAYGSDQSSEATAVHRPEFCYGAQGFDVTSLGTTELALPGSRLALQQLVAQQGTRVEPVMYWVTLGTSATLPGWGRKLAQLRHGLKGEIADGMLVRVSSFGPKDPEQQFELQRAFLADLREALPAAARDQYFGR